MIAFLDNALLQALIFGFLALSVFISLRVLDFPDLTIEGSYPLGAAVSASFIVHASSPWLGVIFSLLFGFMAGVFTAYLHEYLRVGKLLSGIIIAIALYSINFRIMGASSNLYIGKENNPLMFLNEWNQYISGLLLNEHRGVIYPVTNLILIIIVCLLLYFLVKLLKSKLGSVIRFSRGDQNGLITSVGIDSRLVKMLGLGLANLFASVAGILSLYNDGTASITMGFGVILTALVALVIGEYIVGLFHNDLTDVWPTVIAPFIGMFVYNLIIAGVRYLNISVQGIIGIPAFDSQLQFFNSDVKILSALIILLFYVRQLKRNTTSPFGGL